MLEDLRPEGRRRHAPGPAAQAGRPRLCPHRGLRRGHRRLVRRPGRRGWPARKTFAGALVQTMRYGEEPAPGGRLLRLRQAPGRASPPPASCRARRSATTTSTTPTRPSSWSPSSIRPRRAAVAIIKHANPCGVALGDLEAAYRRALQCDPVSAFGGIVAVNRRLDAAAAAEIVKIFTEVVIAPEADDDAIALFAAKKNLRLLVTGGLPDPAAPGETFRSVAGRLPGPGPRRRADHRRRPEDRHPSARPPRRRCATCCSPSPSPSTSSPTPSSSPRTARPPASAPAR